MRPPRAILDDAQIAVVSDAVIRFCARNLHVDSQRAPARPDPIQELQAGMAFWQTKLDVDWPADFHNADYKEWATESRDFSDEWWTRFLRRLYDWKALRPATYAELTARFVERRDALSLAWAVRCAPYRDLDITGVSWVQVGGFADLVGEIKPMKNLASPVFTSKFCHFLLPMVFPVVDTEGSGNRWSRYQQYFDHVQSVWASTPDDDRADLIAAMTEAVESAGVKLNPEFPLVNKDRRTATDRPATSARLTPPRSAIARGGPACARTRARCVATYLAGADSARIIVS